MIIRMDDIRRLGYCSRGVREFFLKHELDYPDFLENGIESEILLSVSGNDQMVIDVVEAAHGKQ